MANTLTALVPKILSRGLLALRENAVMPRLVNRSIGDGAREKGDTIDIPLSAAATTRTVTPAVTQAANVDFTPTKVQLPLDQWKESPFQLSDKELAEIDADDSFIPMQTSEAIKALANGIDSFILGKFTGIWNYSGTAATTPFATNLDAFRDARKNMNKDLSPLADRRVVLDADAEANAVVLEQFLAADRRGDQGGIIQGEIGQKLGYQWFLDQNIPTHTVGTWTVTGAGRTEVKATATINTSTMIWQGNSSTVTNGGNVVVGDIFTVTGDSQAYVVKTAASVAVAAQATLAIIFSPPLRATIAAAATVSLKGSHVVNLAFHRDAFAFASRPLAESQIAGGLGSIFSTMVDPVSGIALRLEVNRQYKQTTWAFDSLYGAVLVRPELAARIAG